MDVKVTVGGIEAVVTVADAHEAARLLSSLSNLSSAVPVANTSSTPGLPVRADTTIQTAEKVDMLNLENMLKDLRGTRAARLLSKLAEAPSGLRDDEIRVILGLDADANFGPTISTISKACVRHGIPKEHVFHSAQRRRPDKKIEYLFKISEHAATIISEIPDYGKQPGYKIQFPNRG